MDFEKMWERIISELMGNPIDICTVPSNNKEPLWYCAYIDSSNLYVRNSNTRTPSTKMSGTRKITKKDFMTVASYYERWSNGERHLRQVVRELSRNTAYIFGLIARFSD